MEYNFDKYITLPLKQVEKKLRSKYDLEFEENHPPRQQQGIGHKRVIAIKKENEFTIKIIWCFEDYQ
ncbi:MAG: hypothetical protein ACOC4G_02695 [Bacillota bacterium]